MQLRWDIIAWSLGITFLSGVTYSGWKYETRISVLETKFDYIKEKLDKIDNKLDKSNGPEIPNRPSPSKPNLPDNK